MQKLLSFGEGYRTYIIGTLMILLGLLQGDQKLILEGIAFITLRAAKK